MTNGAWPWFNGGRPNRYITQHIITGFGHLKQLNVVSSPNESSMIEKAIGYLDSEFIKEYKDIRKYNKDVELSKDHLSYTQLHYLYMRSFFSDIEKSLPAAPRIFLPIPGISSRRRKRQQGILSSSMQKD